MRFRLALAFLGMGLSAAIAQSGDERPQFKTFAAAYRDVRAAMPVLDTKDKRQFRTRLRAAANERPNFAGHYVLLRWGCGTSCVAGAVIDAFTGQVTFLPFSICCAENTDDKFDPIEHHADSRLVIFTGLRNEEGVNGAHFYLFEKGRFVHLKTIKRSASTD
jgi:hypothetical protein